MSVFQRMSRAVREWARDRASRRAGRRHVPDDIRRQARDVAGVTGWMYSRGWDELARVKPSYLQSFETPRVPPSLHISDRDRRRAGLAVPLAERCIEDYADPDAPRPGPWSTAELSQAPSRNRRRRRPDPTPPPA